MRDDARGGQSEALKFLKGYGVKLFKMAWNEAEKKGHTECMKLLEGWIETRGN